MSSLDGSLHRSGGRLRQRTDIGERLRVCGHLDHARAHVDPLFVDKAVR